MGENFVSRVRLHKGTWRRARSLPYVRPYRKPSLEPEIPARACQRLFYCSGRPGLGNGRLEGAHNALKWPKITQTGSGQSPGHVQTGSTDLVCVQVPQGHERRPLGTRGTHWASVCGQFVVLPPDGGM